jgi:hypothetical protein
MLRTSNAARTRVGVAEYFDNTSRPRSSSTTGLFWGDLS